MVLREQRLWHLLRQTDTAYTIWQAMSGSGLVIFLMKIITANSRVTNSVAIPPDQSAASIPANRMRETNVSSKVVRIYAMCRIAKITGQPQGRLPLKIPGCLIWGFGV